MLPWCFYYLFQKIKLPWNLMSSSDNHVILPGGSVAGVSVVQRQDRPGVAAGCSLTGLWYWCCGCSISFLLTHGLSMWCGLHDACQLGSKREHSKQASSNFPATYQVSVYIALAKIPSAKASHTAQLRVTESWLYTTSWIPKSVALWGPPTSQYISFCVLAGLSGCCLLQNFSWQI